MALRYHRTMLRFLMLSVVACSTIQTPTSPTTASDYDQICESIASDLETLNRQFPQLTNYRAIDARNGCSIRYRYKTHRATHAGGWSASVPNPDPDGIWFHIGIWDPNDPREANAQINTQPVLPDWTIGQRRVTFLILEGSQTQHVSAAIVQILLRHQLRGP